MMSDTRKDPELRFWSKVLRKSDQECWEWTAGKNGVGYGSFRPGGKAEKVLAHRFSYELTNGRIPTSRHWICHRCDNPGCVNPSHLFLGDAKVNFDDMVQKGRRRIGWNPNSRPPYVRGSQVGTARMDEAQATEFRAQMLAGKAVRALARETGISRDALKKLRNRETWRHVP